MLKMFNLKLKDMILKKSNKANLEKKRIIFFQIGFIAALSLALFAFEWSSPGTTETTDLYASYTGVDVTEVPKTFREEKVEAKKSPQFLIDLKVLDNDVEIDDDINFISEEDIPDWIGEGLLTNETETEVKDEIFINPAEPPVFPDGSFLEYVGENIEFPIAAQEAGMTGKVIAQFVVGKDGRLTDIKILQSSHKLFTEAVLEVLKNSPNWKPGKQSGRPVKVMMAMPFKFELTR